MGSLHFLPRMFRPRRTEADDVSAAFTACCNALNPLSPKARDMVSRWVQERYAAQLEEDLEPVAPLSNQAELDARYVQNITRER